MRSLNVCQGSREGGDREGGTRAVPHVITRPGKKGEHFKKTAPLATVAATLFATSGTARETIARSGSNAADQSRRCACLKSF
jgi:hypothetical protein